MKKNKKEYAEGTVRGELNVLRLILTVVYGAGMGLFGWLITNVEGQTKRGFVVTFFLLFLVLFVRSCKRLLTERLQDAIDEWIENAVRWLFRPLVFVINKVAKWLGIGRWRGWGEDEKTFIFKEKGQARKRKRLKNDQKWADQPDNRRRVRFLFVEYMVKRIRGGYMYRRQMTPDEIAEELPLDADEKLLFETYDAARYAEDAEISDEVVKVLTKVAARK